MNKLFLAFLFFSVAVVNGCDSSFSDSPQTTIASVSTQFSECINMSPAALAQMKQVRMQQIAISSNQMLQIEIFIKPIANQSDIDALGEQIKSMPEVKAAEFVSKEAALEKMKKNFQGHEEVFSDLQGNPLPASYSLTLYDANDVTTVASRFFEMPLIDNTPGAHDGVKYTDVQQQLQDQQAMQDFIDNARSCQEEQ